MASQGHDELIVILVVLNLFLETEKYIHILSTPRWSRYLRSFLMEDKDPFIHPTKYMAADDLETQGQSSVSYYET